MPQNRVDKLKVKYASSDPTKPKNEPGMARPASMKHYPKGTHKRTRSRRLQLRDQHS